MASYSLIVNCAPATTVTISALTFLDNHTFGSFVIPLVSVAFGSFYYHPTTAARRFMVLS